MLKAPLTLQRILATATLAVGASAALAQAPVPAHPSGASPAPKGEADWAFFEKYCTECHNATDWAGGVAFDTLTPDGIGEDAEIFEEAVRKLRGRLMPPPNKPQPQQHDIDTLVSWLERRLDAAAAEHPNPGNVVLHRLNRTEYARAVEDLLALKIDAAALLPRDTKADGFDNVANVLRVSPSFLDQYIVAAHEVSTQAVGNPKPGPASVTYRASQESSQTRHIDGLPLGTRGGMLVEHLFPADGEYTFTVNQSGGGGGGYIAGLDSRQKLIMTIDGEKVFEQEVGGEQDLKSLDQLQAPAAKAIRDRFADIKVKVPAGPHKVGFAFVARSFAESEDTLEPLGGLNFQSREPFVFGFDVVGPANPTGITETPSRRKIFTCRPQNETEELPCAQKIVAQLARQAYRRPVTDADLESPMRFYKAGRQKDGFEAGIQQALMAILASPKFLYRLEAVPQDAKPGSIYRISDFELASRLSFFLWSQGPDEELLKTAETGKLHEPEVIEAQVRRMLADPRAKSLVTNFAAQWLLVDEVDAIEPDPNIFPEFDGALRAAFKKEAELFVDSVLSKDQSVVTLLTADYTFVNERLALHYGIPNIRGDRFRRVHLTDSKRYGLLGKGSFLMGMSYANRTSPVRRGAYILETLTGTPPHAPPPGVEALKENVDGKKAVTVRERMEAHRSDPTCNSCHGIIDPLGFSLENFDAIGAWREKDREAGTMIDAAGELHGKPLNGPDDLRNVLVSRPEQFVQTVTEKLLTYALGRGVEYHDMPTVRAIVRDAAKHEYRFSSIIAGIVKSEPFTMQMVPKIETPTSTAQTDVPK
jgi:hypothetical protein